MSATRKAAFAGRFYPSGRDECLRAVSAMTRSVDIAGTPVGAIVPHAGWVYSGATAALAINALAAAKPDCVVIFGATHTPQRAAACMYAEGAWETPLGRLQVDEGLAKRLLDSKLISVDARAHEFEHSIEVQLPFVQYALGAVDILPIRVSPGVDAPEIGRVCAREALAGGGRAVFIGSTDLTHYGPAYGFEPHGSGDEGIGWAKNVNDRRLVDLIVAMDADGVVREASRNGNACGAGAVAATIAAAREMGASKYVEFEHITSSDRELELGGKSGNSVGYESGVFTI